MKQLNFAIIKLTFSLIFGILLGFYFNISLFFTIVSSISLLVLLQIVFKLTKRQYNSSLAFTIVAILTSISLGILVQNFHEQQNWKSHYTNTKPFNTSKVLPMTLKIVEVLKPSKYQKKYIAEILKLKDEKALGKLLINVSIESLNTDLKVDDLIYTETEIRPIDKPLNPHQFDYSNYLEKRYIYHQIYTSRN